MAASHYRSTLDIPYTRHIPWKDIFPQEKKILKDQTKVLAIMQKELTSIGKMLQRENQKPICTSQFAEWPAPWKPSLAEKNIFFRVFFLNQGRSLAITCTVTLRSVSKRAEGNHFICTEDNNKVWSILLPFCRTFRSIRHWRNFVISLSLLKETDEINKFQWSLHVSAWQIHAPWVTSDMVLIRPDKKRWRSNSWHLSACLYWFTKFLVLFLFLFFRTRCVTHQNALPSSPITIFAPSFIRSSFPKKKKKATTIEQFSPSANKRKAVTLLNHSFFPYKHEQGQSLSSV